MLRLAAAALTLAMLSGAGTAAETRTLSNDGYWRSYVTAADDGTPLCGASTRLDNGGSFYIKWFKGQRHLVVQVFKRGWAIPPGVQAPIRLTFPGTEPWTANSAKPTRTSTFLEFTIPPDKVRSFTHDFTASPAMRLEFGAGNEDPWTLNLAGSTPTISSLVRCIEAVAGPADDTQPYAYARSTQPFSAGSSQPFGAPPSQPFAAPPPSQPFAPPGADTPAGGRKRFDPDPGDIND